MARRSSVLAVLLNGRGVGRLSRAADGAIDFRYARDWLDWEHAIPVSLSLPLDTRRYTGAAVTAVFDNLLPDNDDIRRRIAGRVGADGADAYSLLAAVGRDCVGALQFLGEGEEAVPGALDAEPMSDDAVADILRDLGRAPLGLRGDDAFRISIAGAQEKTALLWWDGRWHRPIGATPTTHILKPPIGALPNGIDRPTASRTSICAFASCANWACRSRQPVSTGSAEGRYWRSSASTGCGRATAACCAGRRRTCARRSACRPCANMRITAGRASPTSCACSPPATAPTSTGAW
jgi:HipA-like protein